MAVYKITSLNSARGSGIKFDKLESLASSFTIDAGAFLISTDSTGVALRGPAAWTATVNGYIAGNAVGLHLNGSLGAAKVVVGESGGVRAVTWGIYANTNATIDNSGFILGQTEGIRLTGTGTNSIINKGTIGGANIAIQSTAATANDTVTNSGLIDGGIGLGGGNNKLVNTGRITYDEYFGLAANVFMGEGTDIVDNKGRIDGYVQLGMDTLGEGANTLLNAGFITDMNIDGYGYIGGQGVDTVNNSSKTSLISGGVNLSEGNNVLTNLGSIGRTLSGYSVEAGAGADKVTNSGTLAGAVILGAGVNTLLNSGKITDTDLNGNGYLGGAGADTVNNSSSAAVIAGGVELDEGNNVLSNLGTIGMNVEAKSVTAGAGTDKITNSGTMIGAVRLGEGLNTFTNSGKVNVGTGSSLNSIVAVLGGDVKDTLSNSGTIVGGVQLRDGADVFTNTGFVLGKIEMGRGNDTFTGGNNAEDVNDDLGSDIFRLGGGNDIFYSFAGAGEHDAGSPQQDIVDGGLGIDHYATGGFTAHGLYVNLDTVAHTNTGLTIPAYSVAKTSARTIDGNVDIITNFENVSGTNTHDVIFGSAVANVLNGMGGDDELWGLAGNDTLYSGGSSSGGDILIGGAGADKLYGDDGSRDVFMFTKTTDSGMTTATRDEIFRFNEADLDQISLWYIDANTLLAGMQDFSSSIIVNSVFTGTAGQIRVYESATGWMVEGDVNADKKADFQIAVRDLGHTIGWGAEDFIVS